MSLSASEHYKRMEAKRQRKKVRPREAAGSKFATGLPELGRYLVPDTLGDITVPASVPGHHLQDLSGSEQEALWQQPLPKTAGFALQSAPCQLAFNE